MKGFGILLIILIYSCAPDPIPDPETVFLVAPINLEACITASSVNDSEKQVQFQWTASLHTDQYELIIQNSITQEKYTYNTVLLNASVILPSGAPYLWFVRSKSTISPVTTDSEVWQFYLEANPLESHLPFPAILISPKNESKFSLNTNNDFLFEWKGNDLDQDIDFYDLYLGTNSEEILLKKEGIKETQSTISLESRSLYYWNIVTQDKNQNKSRSETYSFETE